jgi:hypothetical protein
MTQRILAGLAGLALALALAGCDVGPSCDERGGVLVPIKTGSVLVWHCFAESSSS